MNTIENMLPKGERNAVPTEKLLQMVGAASERALRERIAEERKRGAVILSSNRKPGGYFRPESQEEIAVFVRKLEKKGKSTLLAVRSAKKAMGEYDAQMSLDDYLNAADEPSGSEQ